MMLYAIAYIPNYVNLK